MAHVRDIMVRDVVSIGDDKTALDAAAVLKERKISFLVVTSDSEPVGLVTERDFVHKIVAKNRVPGKVRLGSIMTRRFKWVAPDSTVEEAVRKMLNGNVRRLLVLDGKKMAGIITQTDLTEFLRSRLLIDGTVERAAKG